ncbi:MAG: cobalamin-dependent protein, partial [Candidatus Omnitrophica bacterium]|nr:cobalamin-dependent protein [Candidatus Omnitrophota bacterium]
MKKARVLLIYPNFHGMNMLPPAIAIFSRILNNNGFETRLFDSTYYKIGTDFDSDKVKEKNLAVRPFDLSKQVSVKSTDPYEDLDRLVNTFQPDLIAMSATEDTFYLGLSFLKYIDKYGIPTIVGGVFATFAPEKVIRNKEIDIVCVGEGEDALLKLCESIRDGEDYSGIPNLWVKSPDGKIRKNEVRLVGSIDNNPLPDFSLFEDGRLYRPMAGKVYRMLPVETHRGCPYQCNYCNSPAQIRLYREAGAGNFFRKKSLKSVRRELEFYKNVCKAEYFYFWADTFFAYTDK